MKKLLAIAAVAILAVATQAAPVGWTLMGASDYVNGNYSIFAIGVNGVTSISQITDLVAAGTDVSAYQIGGGSVPSTGTAMVMNSSTQAASITYSGSGTDNYTLFAVVWSADGKTASASGTTSITMDNNSTGKTALFGNQASNLSNNKFTVGPVPEPTTVALLALGLAALGLKRKVA